MDKSPLEFRPVPPAQVDTVWPAFAPLLARCGARGEWTTDDIRGWLTAEKVHLLGVFEGDTMIAGMVYAIRGYPQMRVFIVTHLAGDGGFRWGGALLRWVERTAAENDCRKVKFEGRPEWERVLGPARYKAVSINYEKEIAP
jgi:hypothetical protein